MVGHSGRDLYRFEQRLWVGGHTRIAGVDEVGRGPLAGPVVAAAVVLPDRGFDVEVADSKSLRPAVREHISRELWQRSDVEIGLGVVDVATIDAVNILRATHLAMRKALLALTSLPDWALVDGLPVPDLPCSAEFIVKGDASSASIAAASIVAKVYRDRLMSDYALTYPGYGFERNMGYGTAEHLAALHRLGVCPLHRTSFSPVARILQRVPEQMKFSFGDPE